MIVTRFTRLVHDQHQAENTRVIGDVHKTLTVQNRRAETISSRIALEQDRTRFGWQSTPVPAAISRSSSAFPEVRHAG
mgnify:CR=1 FL=1